MPIMQPISANLICLKLGRLDFRSTKRDPVFSGFSVLGSPQLRLAVLAKIDDVACHVTSGVSKVQPTFMGQIDWSPPHARHVDPIIVEGRQSLVAQFIAVRQALGVVEMGS